MFETAPTFVAPTLPLFMGYSPDPPPAANLARWRVAVVSTLGEVDEVLGEAERLGCREREVVQVREDSFQVRWR